MCIHSRGVVALTPVREPEVSRYRAYNNNMYTHVRMMLGPYLLKARGLRERTCKGTEGACVCERESA